MKNSLKEKQGITLIALVITIIVLLILAGDNGILTQANKAKYDTEKSEAKERIQVEVLGSYGIDGKIDIATLKANLTENVLGATVGNETKLPLTVTVNGYTFIVNENGSVDETVSEDSSNVTNWDEIFADAIENLDEYLQRASTLGQI